VQIDLSTLTPAELLELSKKAQELAGEKPKKKRRKHALPKALSGADMEKMLSVPNLSTKSGLKNRVMLEVMRGAGLRVSEVCNLTPADVDMEGGDIFVQNGKFSRDRHIPIGPDLIEWLQRWNAIRPESEWFFCTFQGGQLNQRQIRSMCYRISKKANVSVQDGHKKKPVSPHCLRHTYATNLLESGAVNLPELMLLMGHEDLGTTQIYLHVSNPALAAKIKALG